MGFKGGWVFSFVILSYFIMNFGVEVYANGVKEPEFSAPAGLYEEEFELELLSSNDGDKIYYTLNGKEPVISQEDTYLYEGPLELSFEPLREKDSKYFCGTIIRAITVDKVGNQSEVTTASYFLSPHVKERYQLPIISIVTHPDNLYDFDIGIMVPDNTKSKGKEWERPVHIELFDEDGQIQLDMNAGMRLHGAASRDWDFKSFRLYARNEYDEQNWFEFPIFQDSYIKSVVKSGVKEGEEITKFKRILLRNGGNDGTAWDGTFIRDTLAQSFMANTSLDLQSFAPAITFLNGEFYGIQNIQERQDEKYIEAHYGIAEEDSVIYEFSIDSYDMAGVQHADLSHGEEEDLAFYQMLYEYVRDQDMSLPEHYAKVNEWMDIENYVDYLILSLYTANGDWPGNNVKAWRMRTEYNKDAEYGKDGRLRWLVFDLDFAFGLYEPGHLNITKDSLANAIRTGGRDWPNPDGSTLLFRNLLENETFKQYFVGRYLDLMNTNFNADEGKELVDKLSYQYHLAMSEYVKRYHTMGSWYENLEGIKKFIDRRSVFTRTHLQRKFSLGDEYTIKVKGIGENSDIWGGKIRINTIELTNSTMGVKDGTWEGIYYKDLSTIIEAIPDDGYEFVSWGSDLLDGEMKIDISLLIGEENMLQITPVFQKSQEVSNVSSALNIAQEEVLGKGMTYIWIIIFVVLLIFGFIGYHSYIKRKKGL